MHMSLQEIIALLLVLAAAFTYLNERFLRITPTIGIVVITLLIAASMLAIEAAGWDIGRAHVVQFLETVDFRRTLMDGVLGFLLFASALHIDVAVLRTQKWHVLLLATVGTLLCTVVVAGATWLFLGWLGIQVAFIHALLFGALISPTDPIAAVSVLKRAGLPKRMEVLISGESLFNDGIAAVLFAVLATIAITGETPTVAGIALEFGFEVVGGVLLGVVVGALMTSLMRGVSDTGAHLLFTIALVAGSGAVAHHLHASNPIAMVVAGLLVSQLAPRSTDQAASHTLKSMWGTIEELLNVVVFLLIGLLALAGPATHAVVPMLLAILIVPLGRFVSIGAAVLLSHAHRRRDTREFQISMLLTWAGLRGGISLALALSLPIFEYRELILEMTFAVVVFSLLVQGLTVGRLYSQEQLQRLDELESWMD